MNIIALIIQLICGALGGNISGKLLKNIDLGTLGNSIAGIVGGGVGGQILNALGLFAGAGRLFRSGQHHRQHCVGGGWGRRADGDYRNDQVLAG